MGSCKQKYKFDSRFLLRLSIEKIFSITVVLKKNIYIIYRRTVKGQFKY